MRCPLHAGQPERAADIDVGIAPGCPEHLSRTECRVVRRPATPSWESRAAWRSSRSAATITSDRHFGTPEAGFGGCLTEPTDVTVDRVPPERPRADRVLRPNWYKDWVARLGFMGVIVFGGGLLLGVFASEDGRSGDAVTYALLTLASVVALGVGIHRSRAAQD